MRRHPALRRARAVLVGTRRFWRQLQRGRIAGGRARDSLLPYAAACAPLIVTSVLAPAWLAWLMAVPSFVALYRVAMELDDVLFGVDAATAFRRYMLPLQLLVFAWGLGVAASGHAAALATSVLAPSTLLALAIWPASRRDRARLQRRVALARVFVPFAVLVFALQSVPAMRSLAGAVRIVRGDA